MTNNVNQIDYKEIEYLIKDQLTGIFEENYSYYEGYNFKIAQEQFFTKPSQVDYFHCVKIFSNKCTLWPNNFTSSNCSCCRTKQHRGV
mgnify:CR=1 FL=1